MRMVEDRIRDRLGELSPRLGDADRPDGAFSATDLLMMDVLQRLKGSRILRGLAPVILNRARNWRYFGLSLAIAGNCERGRPLTESDIKS